LDDEVNCLLLARANRRLITAFGTLSGGGSVD
jgi:hypothetical protein